MVGGFFKIYHNWSILLLLKFGLLLFSGTGDALKNVKMHIPSAIKSGSPVTMSCTYDLEGADLYSIRWYRHDFEFYRYVPKESPPTMVFPLPSTEIDISESNEYDVRILGLQTQLSGEYICEVSADAPLFHTDIKSGYMYIVDYTENEPIITTDKVEYSVGDIIKANCSTPLSFPAANLTWYVNNQKISNIKFTTLPADTEYFEPESSVSFVEIITEPESTVTNYQVGGNVKQTSSSQLPTHTTRSTVYKLDYVQYEGNYDAPRNSNNYHNATSPFRQIIVRMHYQAAVGQDLNLSCEANIFDIYTIKSRIIHVKEISPQIASATDMLSSGSYINPDYFIAISMLFAALTLNQEI